MNDVVTSTKPLQSQEHVLASRNFRLLWLGQAISTFGDKFTEIAIPIFVFELTNSALQLGIAFIVQTVAALLFGIVAGTLTDRWDRRRTMIVADILRAIVILSILLLALLPVSVGIKLFWLYGLSFVAAAIKQFFVPAKVATIPDTVHKTQLVAANSLDQSTMTLVSFLGFGAAGAVIEWVGVNNAFWIDAGTFVLSAVFIALIHLSPAQSEPESEQSSVWADIKTGLKYVWSSPLLQGTVILSIIAPLALGATQPLLLVFSQEILLAGNFGFGLLEGAFAIGIAFGAFILGKKAQTLSRGRLLVIGVIGMGIGQSLGAILPLLVGRSSTNEVLLMAVSLPFFFLGAASNAAVLVGIRTIIQENSPREMIGRIFGVITVVSSTALAAGAGFSGLADVVNVGALILFWGFFLVMVGIAAIMWKTFREA